MKERHKSSILFKKTLEFLEM